MTDDLQPPVCGQCHATGLIGSRECPQCQALCCARCGHWTVPPEDRRERRCEKCQSFLSDNAGNHRHGLRAYQLTERLPDNLEQTIESWRSGIVSHQGGLEELDREPLRAGLVRSLIHNEIVERLAMQRIAKVGLNGQEGKQLASILGAAIDRKARISQVLGLSRRQKDALDLAKAFEDHNRKAGL